MAGVVYSIVAKVAELLVVPVGKHICYPFKYKANMDELKKQAENLTDARNMVQHSIEEAKRQGHEIEDDVKNWMKSVDEFTEGVEKNIIEDKENKAKKMCSIGFCPNLMARYSFSKKAAKTAKNGVNLLEKGKFQKVSYCPAIQRTSSIYITGYNDFDSRTSIFQDIMQTLADDDFNIIGVHGMGGVGKTTLVKRVVGKAFDDKLFDVVVMADVTQTADIQNIQAQIADVLSLKFEEESLSGRAARLRDRLKKEKRVLLVLDDLWKKIDLKDVGIPFGEGGNAEQRQCKLLLTSRDLHVLRDHMNTQKNFQLKILTDEEAGNLFWQIVGDSAKTSDFHATGVEIIRRCAGLPVAIATIASALKNKSPSDWKDALDKPKLFNPRHIEGVEKEVYSVIKLSYDFLQNEEEKLVFLLCSLYNASFNMDIDYLLQYCIGLGVFQGVSTVKQARNRLHEIIDKLKASHLLLDGNTNMCVKMHDVVHAVAISIASTNKLMFNIQDVTDLKETLEEKLPKNSTAMSLLFKDVSELPERLEFPKLELLVLLMKDTSLQIPDPFFEGMEGLKVLHLNEIHMLSLPSSLCRLTSLQTLRLNRCLLGDIAVIGALKRIEILSFLGSNIERLPRDISQLTQLRLLDLRDCSKLKVISPNLISSLTQLEELYIGDSFVGWDVDGRDNASLAELKQLSHLKRLDIRVLDARIILQDLSWLSIFKELDSYILCIGDVWDKFDYFESSRMLKLKLNDSNIYLGNEFRLLLDRAEDLHLDVLKGVKNVVYQLDGKGFPQLKHLHVRNDLEIQCIISAVGLGLCNVFPKLESLFLDELVNLKKICHGQLAPDSFNKLRIMKVEKCDTLKHLFSFSMVKNLSQLKEIEVTNCKKLEEIIFNESEEQVHQNDRISRVEFTQLLSLTLRDLPRLTSFVFHSLTPNTESQEIVSEDQPRGFMSLFSQNVAFPCLKELSLFGLPKLLYLWKEDSQPRIVFENLTNLTVARCGNLKTLVPFSLPLEKLTTLTVKSCNGLTNLMTLSTAKTLVQLKAITIEECIMLEEIITDVGDEEIRTAEAEKDAAIDKITLSMLNSVTLDRLPNLITFHSGSNTLECPSLTNIDIKYCPKMQAFVFPDTKDLSIRSGSHFSEKVVLPISASLYPCGISIQLLPAMSSCLTNLTELTMEGFDNLKYLFPSSMVESLVHLKFLCISNCKPMEVVIITQEERKSSTLFPKLKKLKLKDLPELRTFCCFTGKLIELPSVNKLYIKNCPTMQTFASDSLCADMLAIEEEHEKVNTEREENLPSFFDEKVALPCLKRLLLCKLPGLLHLWKENSHPSKVFENLSHLRVVGCGNLTTLLSSSVSLQNLMHLDVRKCDGLINLVPFSTAQSLKQLKIMIINDCKMIEEIIIDMGDEVMEKIVFDHLIILGLHCLPSLTSFCKGNFTIEFPSLRQVFVIKCLKMMSFSQGVLRTPKLQTLELKEVDSDDDDDDDDDEWFLDSKGDEDSDDYDDLILKSKKGEEDEMNWEGDLNTRIQQFFEERIGCALKKLLDDGVVKREDTEDSCAQHGGASDDSHMVAGRPPMHRTEISSQPLKHRTDVPSTSHGSPPESSKLLTELAPSKLPVIVEKQLHEGHKSQFRRSEKLPDRPSTSREVESSELVDSNEVKGTDVSMTEDSCAQHGGASDNSTAATDRSSDTDTDDPINVWYGEESLDGNSSPEQESLNVSEISQLKRLPPKLYDLKIEGSDALESLPEELMHNNSRYLRRLYIIGCHFLKSIHARSLPNALKTLYISKCEKLEFLSSEGRISEHTSLEHLCIESSCDSLNSFPLAFFPKLRSLFIQGCANFNSISIGLEDHKYLDALEIRDCAQLESFPEGGLRIPNLTSILLSNCKNLKAIPGQLHSLTSLQSLFINECPELESIPEGGLPSSLNLFCIRSCHKLTPCIEWGLHQLNNFSRIEIEGGCRDLESFPEQNLLPVKLNSLQISRFPNLKILNYKGLQHLTSLETLKITGCGELQSLSEEGLPSSLSHLYISDCPLLKSKLHNKREEWYKIAHIPHIQIDGKVIS